MSIQAPVTALERATRTLRAAGIESPEVDAEWLLAHAMGVSRTAARLQQPDIGEELELFRLVSRRARREPLQYVIGEWGFRRLTLNVDRRALIPRPETEVVVERTLARLRELGDEPRVLDVGVGSGAIALAIADEHPAARVVGVDTSRAALELARENAAHTGVQVEFREGGVDAVEEGWDVIVSNPPYVAPGEYATLAPELREWEPYEALIGEGLHEEIARRARTTWLVFEVGDGQAEAIATLLRDLGYADVAVTRDLAGTERVVEGQRA